MEKNGLSEVIRSRGMTYHIETYGCQMNAHDSEKLAGLLAELGFTPAEDAEHASMVLFNTCCVREHAESKLYSNVGVFKHRKKEDPDMIVGVCGCMMQQDDAAKKLAHSFPYVDLIFGTYNMHRLPEMLYNVIMRKERVIMVEEDMNIVEDIPTRRNAPPLAYVNIMQGCDNFCTYCIVPYVRGRERSRTPEAILEEVRGLCRDGYREVMLLGQNVNSYGKGMDCDFPTLLKRVAEETGMERIRFMTSHPKDISSELIRVMKEHENICKSLHLPMQSGSTEILRRMNRRYTRERYLEIIAEVRRQIPGIFLSTDVIVGFPGESEQDYQDTLSIMKEVRFDAAYTFVYSPRKGTQAAEYPDQISKEEKQRRIMELVDLQGQITYESNLSYIGNTEKVLVEGGSRRDDQELCGRTDSGKMVNFVGDAKPGDMVTVEITDAKKTTLFGKIVSR